MPNGKYHARITTMIASVYTVGAIVTLSPDNLQYAAGAIIGLMLHPDLDVNHGRVNSTKIIRKFGSVPTFAWGGVWYMYRRSLKHGGDLSHFPVVGTVGRLTYLFMFAIVLPYIILAPVLHLDLWGELSWWAWQFVSHYKVVLGLMTADFFHWLLDVVTKEHKVRRANNALVEKE